MPTYQRTFPGRPRKSTTPATSFHVTLTRSRTGRTIAISITDLGGTTNAPHVKYTDQDDQHGRGLHLVAALAARLEVHREHQGGRTITAHLRGGL